jgi:DNA replication protein DnaC
MTPAPEKAITHVPLFSGVAALDMEAHIMTLDDGRVWHYLRDCYGHPPGGCIRKQTEAASPYCPECYRDYLAESREVARNETSAKTIDEAISYGLMPAWFAAFQAHSLHPWQRAALDQLHSRNDCCAWIAASRGTGKTSVAYHYAHQMTRAGIMPMFITAGALCDSQCDGRLRKFACVAPLLLLDDIHNMHLSQYSVAALHNVLSARHDKQVRTIVTSEVSGAKFGEMVSAAVGAGKGKSTLDRLSWPKRQCVAIAFDGARNLRRDK